MFAAGTVQDLLLAGARHLEEAGIDPADARAEASSLLAHALGTQREALRLHPDRFVTEPEAADYTQIVRRRMAREPLAYILGTREFYGLTFAVTPAVLIPRPETEFLVEAALRHIAERASRDTGRAAAARVADIGTGSGCIAVAVAVHAPQATIWASDISPEALEVARQNAARHAVAHRVAFLPGDALAPLVPFAPFDLIVSNPPYIAAPEVETLMPEVRDWEPREALGIHSDALQFYRRYARDAPSLLAPGGLLAVEVGAGQAGRVADLWREAGLDRITITRDYSGVERIVAGYCP